MKSSAPLSRAITTSPKSSLDDMAITASGRRAPAALRASLHKASPDISGNCTLVISARIVASSLNRVGTRFVRYDTGDLATPPAGECRDRFLPVGEIVGRAQETFVDQAGRSRALGCYVFGIHGQFWDQLKDLQFVQERDGHMRVRLVPAGSADRALIERTLRRRLPMAVLEFEYVAHIDRRTNGKRQYFVDARGSR